VEVLFMIVIIRGRHLSPGIKVREGIVFTEVKRNLVRERGELELR
jgi:hypothetical protein